MLRTILFSTSTCTILSTLAVVLLPRVASAAEKETPPPSDSEEHLRGLEVTLRPALGSVGSASPIQAAGPSATSPDVPQAIRPGASLYGSSMGGGLQLGFRFHPLVSAGLRGDLGTVSADTPTDGSTGLSRSWQSAGLYVRVYPLALNETALRYVDPWVASGITYVHDAQSFQLPVQAGSRKVDVTYQVDSHAIGVPIAIGIDYRVTKWLSAGPSFEYVIMNPIAGCLKGSAQGVADQRVCTDDTNAKQGLVAQALGAWNAGLTLRVTPF